MSASPPMAAFAPRIFTGSVMHLRLRPKRHQFRYGVFAIWLDVDRLAETLDPLRWFGRERFNLFGFRLRDHGPRDGSGLRPWVEARLRSEGTLGPTDAPPARIMLLSFPRVLGYVFNPLSVYYCYDADGALRWLIYEVKNTFGDQHPYPLAIETDPDGLSRHDQAKEFFVSPFIDMEKTYRFTIAPPGDRLSIRIKEADAEGEYLIACWNGAAEPLSDAMLWRRFLSHPLVTLKVMAGIHWEAVRLALKGVRFLGHPGDENIVVKPDRGELLSASGKINLDK
ncbi:MAG: DUF1365 domain-containing protein [Rhodobacteraceae bacterium]|nr:DUF1365 domain-containing protein [Paracoccaceae bacterium]